jgi:hypothetical protein
MAMPGDIKQGDRQRARPMASSHSALMPFTRSRSREHLQHAAAHRSGISARRGDVSMALATAPPIPAIAPLSGFRMAKINASTPLAAYHSTA